MLGHDGIGLVVEEDEIAGQHIHRPHRKARRRGVEMIEIDQLAQRLAQGRGVVIAGGVLGAGRQQPGIDLVRGEEAGLAQKGAGQGAVHVAALAENVAVRRAQPQRAVGDAGPEFAQPFQPFVDAVAGDDGGIDAADRDPGNPVRLQPRFVQRLVNPRLIGAQGPATLQHQGDALAILAAASFRRVTVLCPCRHYSGIRIEFCVAFRGAAAKSPGAAARGLWHAWAQPDGVAAPTRKEILHAQRQSRPHHRFDQRHRPDHRPRLCQGRRRYRDQRLRRQGRDRERTLRHRKGFRRQGDLLRPPT